MPTFNTKVTGANQVWASPDGQRTIHEVYLDVDGNTVKAKTYSKAIATVGWSGEVETYEKPGKQGPETFVKQPPKEGGSFGASGGASSSGKQVDQGAMYVSYAKDLAIACIKEDGKLDEAAFGAVLEAVATGGAVLYSARPGGELVTTPKPETDEVHTVLDNPVDLKDLNDLFPE